MALEKGKQAPEADEIDMTELAAAIAELNGEAPPSGPVTVQTSIFPVSEKIKKEEEEAAAKAAAFADEVSYADPGDQMSDGTFYLGVFIDKDGEFKNWFAAAEDAKAGNGERLTLNFNEAARYAKDLTAHGHDDWMVPPTNHDPDGADDILKKMFHNAKKIGGFEQKDPGYWSSSADPDQNSYGQYISFSNGCLTYDQKKSKCFVRCVRSTPLP